ncbi:Suppressor of the cold-sensitive snRNP biogenesis mutant brr1-1 [Orbilia brochopaga]|uniref:Suppressor of the cold-sensitive snRNP biogenesis mutant brr1-1 n=1 Tax=Orbilia brochopaga TaxID=3140254 RepID=A0AAV9VD24_9PEZI
MKLTQSLMAVLASTTAPILLVAASPIIDTAVIPKAPLLSSLAAEDHTIPNSYIIVFKQGVNEQTVDAHHQWIQETHAAALKKRSLQIPLGKPSSNFLNTVTEGFADALDGFKHAFDLPGAFKGYAGSFDESTLELIRSHPDVEYVEKDQKVYAYEDPALEHGAPWGLARISHRGALNFGTFNKYLYSAEGGEGVNAYVIDTGTNYEHTDFEGRAKWGKTIPANDADVDGNGHGTHCSGTIAGKKYGVAKKANIIAVKVLKSNGSGTMSDVVKGVEWAVTDHVNTCKKPPKGFKGSVANMSLGGGKSPTLDLAVNAAVKNGVHFAVAAGNDNADACNYSPAAAEQAVTVGASTLGDDRAYFSNHGKCVDIFAPGLNIQSTWIGSKYAVNTISGTSMASPHIAGLLAYFVSLQPAKDSAFAAGTLTPAELKKAMISIASHGKLSGLPGNTVNLLAFNGGGSSNLTDIFGDHNKHKGGYQNGKVDLGDGLLDRIEEIVEDEVKAIFEKARKMVE